MFLYHQLVCLGPWWTRVVHILVLRKKPEEESLAS